MKLSTKQLELIERIVVGRSENANDYTNSGKLYYSVKEKLRNLLIQRFKGTDVPFDWVRGDEKYVLFSSPHKGEEKGWRLDGMWAMLEDVNQVQLIEGIETEHVVQCMLEFTALYDGGINCTIEGKEQLTPEEYRNKVLDEVISYLGAFYGDYEPEIEPGDEELEISEVEADMAILADLATNDAEDIADLIIAMDRASDGFLEEAVMDCHVLEELLDTINSNMDYMYDNIYILKNLWMFMAPYVFSNPDNEVCVDSISSEEIYWYSTYRERVPEEVRENVDLAIKIFDNPLPDTATDAEDFDWNHLHIVTVMYQAYDKINLQDIHPLWKDVKEYLAEILPELREKYMVSDSLNESRTLLFLCRFFAVQPVFRYEQYGLCRQALQ